MNIDKTNLDQFTLVVSGDELRIISLVLSDCEVYKQGLADKLYREIHEILYDTCPGIY